MELQVVINQIAVIFILMAVGFVLGKAKILTEDGNKIVSKLVLCVALPCTILSSVFENEIEITVGDTVSFLLLSLLTILIAFLVSMPVVRLMGGDKANRGLLNFISIFSNCAFMGFPVVIAILGVSAAYYVALFNISFGAVVFSLGIFMISYKKNGNKNKSGPAFDPRRLINPTLIVSLLAIPIALTGIRFPDIVIDTVRIAGGVTTPGAMIVIGATFAYIPLKNVFSEWRIIPVTLMKLIVIPVVTWLVLRQIITNDFLLAILVILSAMPTATLASMLAIEYDGNEPLASAGVFLTTLLCGVTVPLLVYFLLI